MLPSTVHTWLTLATTLSWFSSILSLAFWNMQFTKTISTQRTKTRNLNTSNRHEWRSVWHFQHLLQTGIDASDVNTEQVYLTVIPYKATKLMHLCSLHSYTIRGNYGEIRYLHTAHLYCLPKPLDIHQQNRECLRIFLVILYIAPFHPWDF
jgi:hypothetical protein